MRFTPSEGEVGDSIPFFWHGEYHLFYLKPRSPLGDRFPWSHAVSRDLVHWDELPDALLPGEPGEPDCQGCWTGSVVEAGGQFHIFYTGWNPGSPTPQTICHATSYDLVGWTKDAANPILKPDPRWYAAQDWRDPFVFRNAAESCYWMLITAKVRDEGAGPTRGCIAIARSQDLPRRWRGLPQARREWEVWPPLWLYNAFHPPECPDMLDLGEWRALVFSDVTTQYRVARRLEGPWERPADASLDDVGLYAAKTFHAGGRHLLVGWIASHEGARDAGSRLWGGVLSLPREVSVGADGTLRVCCAPEIVAALRNLAADLKSPWLAVSGDWSKRGGQVAVNASEADSLLALPGAPTDYLVQFDVTLRKGGRAGAIVRLSESGDAGYLLTLDQARRQLALRRWEGWREGRPIYERPLPLPAGRSVKCRVFVQGNVLEAFVDDRVALSARIYDRPTGGLGLYAVAGEASFRELRVLTR